VAVVTMLRMAQDCHLSLLVAASDGVAQPL